MEMIIVGQEKNKENVKVVKRKFNTQWPDIEAEHIHLL